MGVGMATGRRSLSASSAATAEARGAPSPSPSLSLSPSASRVRCLPAGDVVAHRAGGEGRAAVCSFFDFNPSKLKAKNWDKWASYSQVTVG